MQGLFLLSVVFAPARADDAPVLLQRPGWSISLPPGADPFEVPCADTELMAPACFYVTGGGTLIVGGVQNPEFSTLRGAAAAFDATVVRRGAVQGTLTERVDGQGRFIWWHQINQSGAPWNEAILVQGFDEEDAWFVFASAPVGGPNPSALATTLRTFRTTAPDPFTGPPPPPFSYPTPPAPNGVDPDQPRLAALLSGAFAALDAGDPGLAEIRARRAHAIGVHGARMVLAIIAVQAGRREDAIYWIQEEALAERLFPSDVWAESDLAPLFLDERWSRLVDWLQDLVRYGRENPDEVELVVTPSGYRPGTPIGVAIGLHGLGDAPRSFAEGWYQEMADRTKLAMVAVSGTARWGRGGYRWSEDPVLDEARVERALARLGDRIRVKEGATLLFGFSEGAQMALELAALHPERYAGAIAMSSGGLSTFNLRPAPGTLVARRFVLTVGAREAPGNLDLQRRDTAGLEVAGADVTAYEYPQQSEHGPPYDVLTAFPQWCSYVLRGKEMRWPN